MIDLSALPVSSLLAGAKLTPEALAVVQPDMSTSDALNVLKAKDMSNESIPLLSEALPERERVWWASQSAKRVAPAASATTRQRLVQRRRGQRRHRQMLLAQLRTLRARLAIKAQRDGLPSPRHGPTPPSEPKRPG